MGHELTPLPGGSNHLSGASHGMGILEQAMSRGANRTSFKPGCKPGPGRRPIGSRSKLQELTAA